MKFTLLSKEQLIDNPLDVIKKYGAAVAPTDLSILLGNNANETMDVTTPEGDSASWQWTKTGKDGYVYTVYSGSHRGGLRPRQGTDVIRPVLPPEETKKLTPTATKNGPNGTTIVEYGEYPQTIVRDPDLEKQLKENASVKMTGKSYKLASSQSRTLEYEYNGKKYVKVTADLCGDQCITGVGPLEDGKDYWVEVQPIEWLQDPTGHWISKKGLISGIAFDNYMIYDGNFENTSMKHYLDTRFAKEMEPSMRSAGKEASKAKKTIDRVSLRKRLSDLRTEQKQTISALSHGTKERNDRAGELLKMRKEYYDAKKFFDHLPAKANPKFVKQQIEAIEKYEKIVGDLPAVKNKGPARRKGGHEGM